MSDLKDQLIKLGHAQPELQDHLRPILATLSKKARKNEYVFFGLMPYGERSQYYITIFEELDESINLSELEAKGKALEATLQSAMKKIKNKVTFTEKNQRGPVDVIEKFRLSGEPRLVMKNRVPYLTVGVEGSMRGGWQHEGDVKAELESTLGMRVEFKKVA